LSDSILRGRVQSSIENQREREREREREMREREREREREIQLDQINYVKVFTL
jgi:hypothetical protein